MKRVQPRRPRCSPPRPNPTETSLPLTALWEKIPSEQQRHVLRVFGKILLRKLQESDAGHQETKALLEAALQRIAELEKKLGGGTAKFDKPFSTRAEEKRQEERGNKPKKRKLSRKGRRGRLSNHDKIKLAERTEKVYPEGVAHDD